MHYAILAFVITVTLVTLDRSVTALEIDGHNVELVTCDRYGPWSACDQQSGQRRRLCYTKDGGAVTIGEICRCHKWGCWSPCTQGFRWRRCQETGEYFFETCPCKEICPLLGSGCNVMSYGWQQIHLPQCCAYEDGCQAFTCFNGVWDCTEYC